MNNDTTKLRVIEMPNLTQAMKWPERDGSGYIHAAHHLGDTVGIQHQVAGQFGWRLLEVTDDTYVYRDPVTGTLVAMPGAEFRRHFVDFRYNPS